MGDSHVVCHRSTGISGGHSHEYRRDRVLEAAHKAAATSTTGVIGAAEDEVSTAIAKLFSGYGQEFQALSAQAASFHAEFVQTLNSAGAGYAASEAANTSGLPALSIWKILTGRPLVGNGDNAAAGSGKSGGDGGWLVGNGGNGGKGGNGRHQRPTRPGRDHQPDLATRRKIAEFATELGDFASAGEATSSRTSHPSKGSRAATGTGTA